MDADFDIAWINRAAAGAGLGDMTPEQIDALLDLAGVAARQSGDRRNAPLLTFLAGLGLGSGGDPATAETIARFAPPA